jgi:hypothetical protein
LKGLTILEAYYNALTGSTELGRLKGLTALDAGGNQLSGNLPDLGNLTSLLDSGKRDDAINRS